MSNLSTWYEVCVWGQGDGGQVDNSVTATLDSAKAAVARFQALYPDAHMIFVRQHTRGRHGFRVLHKLTVQAVKP